MTFYLMPILSYLIGSLLFSIIVSRYFKLNDPRTYGSKNPGTTNAFRQSKYFGGLVFILDFLKGVIIAYMATSIGSSHSWIATCTILTGFLGHIHSIYFGNGGKGIATGFGIIMFLTPNIALLTISIWAIFAWASSNIGIASIVAVAFYMTTNLIYPTPFSLATLIMSLLCIYRHKGNIKQFLAKTSATI